MCDTCVSCATVMSRRRRLSALLTLSHCLTTFQFKTSTSNCENKHEMKWIRLWKDRLIAFGVTRNRIFVFTYRNWKFVWLTATERMPAEWEWCRSSWTKHRWSWPNCNRFGPASEAVGSSRNSIASLSGKIDEGLAKYFKAKIVSHIPFSVLNMSPGLSAVDWWYLSKLHAL